MYAGYSQHRLLILTTRTGHYTYECTSAQQDRPYTSRPSRSQQLSNPKLAPKLSAVLPPVEPASKNSPSRAPVDRDHPVNGKNSRPTSRRRRSNSTHSLDSVSSFSTNRSRSSSRTPPPASRAPGARRNRSLSRSPTRSPVRRTISPPVAFTRLGRRRSASPDQYRPSARSKSPERVPKEAYTEARYRRRSRSRSPYRGDKRRSSGSASEGRDTAPVNRSRPAARERSLSPYSQRLAMTKAMNG